MVQTRDMDPDMPCRYRQLSGDHQILYQPRSGCFLCYQNLSSPNIFSLPCAYCPVNDEGIRGCRAASCCQNVKTLCRKSYVVFVVKRIQICQTAYSCRSLETSR